MYQKKRENDRSDKADQESVSGFADGLKRKQKVQRDASLYSFLRRQGIQPSAKRSASAHTAVPAVPGRFNESPPEAQG